MINFKNETENMIWWIVKSVDNTIIHHGILEPQMLLESGLEVYFSYDNEQDWLSELTLLGITIS